MKRDMELIRQIAFVVEAKGRSIDAGVKSTELQIPGYTPEQIAFHCALMVEAKLILTIDLTYLGSKYKEYEIVRLTWTGCDFVDAARDEKTWTHVNSKVRESVTSVTFDVLVGLLKAEAAKLLGWATGIEITA